jgi:tetratricopeptide (TPR) repeat protein
LKRQYVVGAIALLIAFWASFFWTRNVNKNGISASPSRSGGVPGQAAGVGGQQAAMGDVQATIKKAKDNPGDPQAQIDAAKMEYQINRIPEAIEYLKQAHKDDPKDLNTTAIIASLYFDQKNYAESENWYKQALEIKPDEPELLTELGATYIERNPPEPDKAIGSIQAALKINPKDTHALAHLTEAYLLKKDAHSAEDALGRIKDAEPSNQMIATLQAQIDALKSGKQVVLPSETNN